MDDGATAKANQVTDHKAQATGRKDLPALPVAACATWQPKFETE
jgi:hypothetical protein